MKIGLKGIILGIIAIVILAVIGGIAAFFNLGEKPAAVLLPDDDFCQMTETGWRCQLSHEVETGEINAEKQRQYEEKEAYFTAKCKEQGFVWRGASGYGLPSYWRYCDSKYSDAGKKCSSSINCQGDCAVDPDEWDWVEKNCKNEYADSQMFFSCSVEPEGKCIEYPMRKCDWWMKKEGKKVFDNTKIMCD